MASNEHDLEKEMLELLRELDSLPEGNGMAPPESNTVDAVTDSDAELLALLDGLESAEPQDENIPVEPPVISSGDAKLEASSSAPVSMNVSSSTAPIANPVKKQRNELQNLIGNSADYQFFIDKNAYEAFIKNNKDKKAVYISPTASRKIDNTITNAYKYKCRIYQSAKDTTMADVSNDVLNEVIAILEIERNMSLLKQFVKNAELERANDCLSQISAKINKINHPLIKNKFIALKNAYCKELNNIYSNKFDELQEKLLDESVSVFSTGAGNDKKIINETLHFLNNMTDFISHMSDGSLKDALARRKEEIEQNFVHFLKDKDGRIDFIQEYLFGELARQIEDDLYGNRDKLLKNQKILLNLWREAKRENSMVSSMPSTRVDIVITESKEMEDQNYDSPTLSGCVGILENILQRDAYKQHKEILMLHSLLNHFKTLEVSPQFMAGFTQNMHILLVQLRGKMLRNELDIEQSIQEVMEIVNYFIPMVLDEAKKTAETELLKVKTALKEKEQEISEKKEAITAARKKIKRISKAIKAKEENEEKFMQGCAKDEEEEVKSYVRSEISNGEREVRANPHAIQTPEFIADLPVEVGNVLDDRMKDLQEIKSSISLEMKEKEGKLIKLALQKLIQELINLKINLLESADIENIREVNLAHDFAGVLDSHIRILSASENEKEIDFGSVLNKIKEDLEWTKKSHAGKDGNKFLVELDRGVLFLNSCIQDRTIKDYNKSKEKQNIPDRKRNPEHITHLEKEIEQKEKELAQLKGFLKISDNIRSGLSRWVQEKKEIFSKKIQSIRHHYEEKRKEFKQDIQQLYNDKKMAKKDLKKMAKEQSVLIEQKRTLEIEQELLQHRIRDLNRTITKPFELFLVSNVYAVIQGFLPAGLENAVLLDDQNRILFVHNGKLLKGEFSIRDRDDIPFYRDVCSSQADTLAMASYSGACNVIEAAARAGKFTLLYDMRQQRSLEIENNARRREAEKKQKLEEKQELERQQQQDIRRSVPDMLEEMSQHRRAIEAQERQKREQEQREVKAQRQQRERKTQQKIRHLEEKKKVLNERTVIPAAQPNGVLSPSIPLSLAIELDMQEQSRQQYNAFLEEEKVEILVLELISLRKKCGDLKRERAEKEKKLNSMERMKIEAEILGIDNEIYSMHDKMILMAKKLEQHVENEMMVLVLLELIKHHFSEIFSDIKSYPEGEKKDQYLAAIRSIVVEVGKKILFIHTDLSFENPEGFIDNGSVDDDSVVDLEALSIIEEVESNDHSDRSSPIIEDAAKKPSLQTLKEKEIAVQQRLDKSHKQVKAAQAKLQARREANLRQYKDGVDFILEHMKQYARLALVTENDKLRAVDRLLKRAQVKLLFLQKNDVSLEEFIKTLRDVKELIKQAQATFNAFNPVSASDGVLATISANIEQLLDLEPDSHVALSVEERRKEKSDLIADRFEYYLGKMGEKNRISLKTQKPDTFYNLGTLETLAQMGDALDKAMAEQRSLETELKAIQGGIKKEQKVQDRHVSSLMPAKDPVKEERGIKKSSGFGFFNFFKASSSASSVSSAPALRADNSVPGLGQ